VRSQHTIINILIYHLILIRFDKQQKRVLTENDYQYRVTGTVGTSPYLNRDLRRVSEDPLPQRRISTDTLLRQARLRGGELTGEYFHNSLVK
jgi:hypothetical protein